MLACSIEFEIRGGGGDGRSIYVPTSSGSAFMNDAAAANPFSWILVDCLATL